MENLSFYKNKKVLVTGHTGFKGSWLSKILVDLGADVVGYALPSPKGEGLFSLCGIEKEINSVLEDIRDYDKLFSVFQKEKPEFVFHLAAQPIVRTSYEQPLYTYETNVMGTVNLLECIRKTDSVVSAVNVTTDKVYENREWEWGYREEDPLDGFDPYSNSKSCSELVTHSYKKSFFSDGSKRISTARAGNVIGGGDFAKDRIIPDCIRAVTKEKKIFIRNPFSVRPFQHVLEPVYLYLLINMMQNKDVKYQGYYNIGPDDRDCITSGELADIFCKKWGKNASWFTEETKGPHEANFLKLDCSRVKKVFGWKPVWDIETAVEKTVEWTKAWFEGEDTSKKMEQQIQEFFRRQKNV